MKYKKVDIDRLNREIFLMTQGHAELLDELLREDGYEPEQLEKKGAEKIKALLFKQRVAINKIQQEGLYAKAKSLFVSAEASTRDAILALLRVKAPQLQFNNLEKMDENDLKDILNENDLLDLMDKIEKNQL